MVVKINGKWRGQSPEEQLAIEKTRFRNRMKLSKCNVVDSKTQRAMHYNRKLLIEK